MVERKVKSPTRQTIVEGTANDRAGDFTSESERAYALQNALQSSARSQNSKAPKAKDSPSEPGILMEDNAPSSSERLADYFAIVGLNDELKPLDNGCDCKSNLQN